MYNHEEYESSTEDDDFNEDNNDWYSDQCLTYISEIVNDNVWSLQNVLSKILAQQIQNLQELKEFLENHEDHFFVENGRVAVYDQVLETSRESAVNYFEEILESYDTYPDYFNLRGHISQAEDDVIYYINNFYPEREFKTFLLEHSDVFVVFDDDTVSLIESESADYFRKWLEKKGDGLPFRNFRGHVEQTPVFIKKFIKTYYPGENGILDFLEKKSNVFYIDNGIVFLNDDDDDD